MGRIAYGLGIALSALAISASPVPIDPLRDASDGRDWPGYGRTYDEQHYSPLRAINRATVARLGLAWSFDLEPGNPVTQPLEVGGTLYITTGYSIIRAIDAASGRQLWRYDPEVYKFAGRKMRTGWGSRGIAYWQGKVYVPASDGRLIALDARTGKPLWTAQTLAPDSLGYVTGAPRIFEGKVVIGQGGADIDNIRGYVTAFDATTGRQLWRFYTVPGNPADGFENEAMAMAAKTWSGEWWKMGGGGTVWNAMSYDPDTDTLFLGVGNGSPWNRKVRSDDKGDNLFLASIVAVAGRTGRYKWHYQLNPGETWDYVAAMDMHLADLVIDGRPRKVLIEAPKNGFLYVIDRTDGKLISAKPFTKVSWASSIDPVTGRPVENPEARYRDGKAFLLYPGTSGAHGWRPSAFSPSSGLIYIPTMVNPTSFDDVGISPSTWKRLPGAAGEQAANAGFAKTADAGTSSLIAWDPVHQRQIWQVPTPGAASGGAMATGGGLVFQGRGDGQFNAYDAGTGHRLWSFQAQAPVFAPPISYQVGGRQYVTVISGAGTGSTSRSQTFARYNIDYRTQKRRVLTFMIGGTAELPVSHPTPPVAVDDPTYRADGEAEARGGREFGLRCARCHGGDAVAAGNAPDLRTSGVPLDRDAFLSVVRDGLLLSAGMPRFEEEDHRTLDDLRQYIRARAAALRKASTETGGGKTSGR